ncbi:MAG: ATP-binding protein [Mesorhizobium sp.]|nr:ATP-binding protein [Mesorhizobium sp.]
MLTRPVDLSSCDTEPIHIIGAVQPFGALVAVDMASRTIEFASANCDAFLGRDWRDLLGAPLGFLLGEANCADLLSRQLIPSLPDLLRPWFVRLPKPDGSEADLECFPHLQGGCLILEFVAREEGPAVVWEEDMVRQRIISELIRPETLTELAQVGAQIIREVTGFDRVMIYRFAPDKHGEVIAESTGRDDSFLGLHYPASDIPDPARRHFVLNVIRTIPDINAVPVPIMARSGEIADANSRTPLDLTFSKLRAVAPVHTEYLNNMGVGASMSISLISNHELWGLVACHHYSPLHLAWSRFRFCELVGGTISALLQSLENTIKLRHSIQAEKTAFDIERDHRNGLALGDVVRNHADAVMTLCGAQGMVLKLGDQVVKMRKTPAADIDYSRLKSALVDGIFASDHLNGLVPEHQEGDADAAGIAYLELSEDGRDFLVMFREPYEQTIRWAGKPEKIETRLDDGTVRLSPRGSFALWREERRGRSIPFTDADYEVMRITRRALFAVNSLDRERAAVTAQRQAEAEEARLRLVLLDAARNRSMGELASALAHELNQPLSAVTNYVNACRQELKNYAVELPGPVESLMDSAVAEASRAADLVRRLRNFIGQGEIALELVDLHAVIRQGVELALAATSDARPNVIFQFDAGMPVMRADPVQIGQVVLNLVRNSLAAMQESSQRILTIATVFEDPLARVVVRDTGIGIAAGMEKTLFEPFHNSTTSGMGIGLSLCRSIVEAHGGGIWIEQVSDGATIAFTLRTDGGRDD